jgi:hypothetical protein
MSAADRWAPRKPPRVRPPFRPIFAIPFLIVFGCGLLGAQQQCDAGVLFAGPITITAGGTYSGNWQSRNPSIPAVSISTAEPVTIVNSRLKGPGDLIDDFAKGNQLTVRNSCFVGTNPNIYGQGKGSPIHTYLSASVLVQNCDFESGGYYGVYIQQYGGDYSPDHTIKILNNRIHNADGRLSDGSGGYLRNREGYAHAIILNNVHGVAGIEIGWNQIINEPNQSGGDIDLINIYESSGTAASPMQIHDNYLQGSYAADPANANGLHFAGTGFVTDGSAQTDPSLTTSFLKVHDNQAVSMGNGGISIAMGHDIEMYSNRVVSHGQLRDGSNYTTSYAVGIDHWDYLYPPPGTPPANFGNNSIHDNLVGLRRQRNSTWERSDYWIPVRPAISFNNFSWPQTTADAPTLADEATELSLWKKKLRANNISVGSNLASPADPAEAKD